MELLIKRILFFLFAATLFFVCCSQNEKVEKDDSPDFYELCFYFSKLPSNAALSDAEAASKTFSRTLSESGLKVLNEKSTLMKSCYFLDKEPDFSAFSVKNTENEVADYLLKAFFKKEHSSLYGIKNSGKTIRKIYDEIQITRKISAAEAPAEGLEITGFDAKTLYFSHYLDNLEIENSFGLNSENKISLNIPADIQGRWKTALFLYNSLDFKKIARPHPGDFAVLALCNDENSAVTVKKNDWQKEFLTKTRAENGRNAINLKLGAANIPFSEETALKYLYSLAFSHRLPFESGSANSPVFNFSSVKPALYLFSGELVFSAPLQDPNSLFLWILSSERQLEKYPDTLYANLLSLKIAKKLVLGDKTFLGGKDLENKNLYIDFEALRNSFFRAGNLSVSGEMPENLYTFSGKTITETVSPVNISEVSGFKALFGDPEINDTTIASFVVRSTKTLEIIDKIEESLIQKGFRPIHRMFEKTRDGDSWGSVSVKTEISNENKLMNLYEKEYKALDKTLSLGVYRVSEK